MNKTTAISLVAGMVLTATVGASPAMGPGAELGLEQWQGGGAAQDADRSPPPWRGVGIGAIVGALLGGPPGFIVGAAGGVLVEQNAGLESDLHTARQEVERLARQQREASVQRESLSRQLSAEREHYRGQLKALADGFVFRIRFRTGQSVMEPEAQHDLEQLAQALAPLPHLVLTLDAYADRRGRTEQNQRLSEARAEAVIRPLIRHGVTAGRLVKLAHGEDAARYPADDPEGLGYDRQVVIRMQYREVP
ncbi:OmpA family protein [Sedimenticola sp.]|uniref:OmpA family protein n=1 Tax=Sedimenticola sp. TaxID=1940285 RepID=UPI003D11F34E